MINEPENLSADQTMTTTPITRYRAPGLAAAACPLLRCPVCGIPNFSPRGLSAHRCRSKPNREQLTPAELELAKHRAAAAA